MHVVWCDMALLYFYYDKIWLKICWFCCYLKCQQYTEWKEREKHFWMSMCATLRPLFEQEQKLYYLYYLFLFHLFRIKIIYIMIYCTHWVHINKYKNIHTFIITTFIKCTDHSLLIIRAMAWDSFTWTQTYTHTLWQGRRLASFFLFLMWWNECVIMGWYQSLALPVF